MKKSLLTIISAIFLVGFSWGQSINVHNGVNFEGISSNGKWAYAINSESGEILLLDIVKNETIYFETEPFAPYVDAASGNGYFVGAFREEAAIMDIDGNWRYLPLPDSQSTYSSSARGTTADASMICGYIDVGTNNGGRLPILWELQSNGEYSCQILPYPEKDFSQLVPQATDALRISDDGSIIAGRLIDWSGMHCLPIVWEKTNDGEWEYRLLGEDLVFNKDVELPFFDPDSRPEQPDPTEYFTEADWEAYYAAIEKYKEDVANDPENWWLYQNPEYNQADYITDRRDEYDAAYAIYAELAMEYNAAMEAYYDALDLFLTGRDIDVYYMNISPNGKYLSVTIGEMEEEPQGWFPEFFTLPAYFDLNTGESKVFNFETDALTMSIANSGNLYYATPNMSLMRNSFVVPAGKEEPIELATWIYDKTNKAIDLSEYFYFYWTEFDMETYEEVEKEGVISGSVLVSMDENILLSTLESPETFEAISYVVNLGLETDIKATGLSSELSIYPNPVEDKLNVSGEFSQLTLINMNGATVLKSNENGVSVSHLPSGVYILKVEVAGQAPVVKKVIKK